MRSPPLVAGPGSSTTTALRLARDDHSAIHLVDRREAHHRQVASQLVREDAQYIGGAGRSPAREAVDQRATHQAGSGAEGQRDDHVASRADAAVDEYLRARPSALD